MQSWDIQGAAVRADEGAGAAGARAPIPFSNQYMFGRVMRCEDICRGFLERVLGIEVASIEYLNAKQVLEPTLTGKGSELDLFVRAREGVFDVEMQCAPRGSLGRRFRFYQGAMDTAGTRKGAAYDELPESAIVFVCGYDPFGLGLPVYRIEPACEGAPGADMGAGQAWVALNCPAWGAEGDEGLRNLLRYVAEGEAAPGDALIESMAGEVAAANDDERWVSDVCAVSYVLEDLERERGIAMRAARREGREEGREEGEARFAALVAALLADGRADDVAAAAEDAECRAKLLAEYGL